MVVRLLANRLFRPDLSKYRSNPGPNATAVCKTHHAAGRHENNRAAARKSEQPRRTDQIMPGYGVAQARAKSDNHL